MTQTKPKFQIGDVVRRMSDGRRCRVRYVAADAYHFEDGTFALLADEDRYVLVEPASGFFRVSREVSSHVLDQHTSHGYENRRDFRDALHRLIQRWGGREGEMADERHGHLRLRFHDTPGGRPDEAWLPLYLLTPCPRPDYMQPPAPPDPLEEELDRAFGFD